MQGHESQGLVSAVSSVELHGHAGAVSRGGGAAGFLRRQDTPHLLGTLGRRPSGGAALSGDREPAQHVGRRAQRCGRRAGGDPHDAAGA